MRRKDKCLFCTSRSCHTRIFRIEEPKYDEIACHRHIQDLEKHSDEVLGAKNGITRTHLSSTRKLKRGEDYESEVEL